MFGHSENVKSPVIYVNPSSVSFLQHDIPVSYLDELLPVNQEIAIYFDIFKKNFTPELNRKKILLRI